MTTHQIQLVQDSWKQVLPIAPIAGELFYTRLFEIAPQVRLMFPHDIKPQAKKLIVMLGFIVGKLHDLESILDDIKKLTKQHKAYGVEAAHFQPVGEALLWTLREGLGSSWNVDLEFAWATTYSILSEEMVKTLET